MAVIDYLIAGGYLRTHYATHHKAKHQHWKLENIWISLKRPARKIDVGSRHSIKNSINEPRIAMLNCSTAKKLPRRTRRDKDKRSGQPALLAAQIKNRRRRKMNNVGLCRLQNSLIDKINGVKVMTIDSHIILYRIVWAEPNNEGMTESGGVSGEKRHSSYGTGQHFLSVTPTPQKEFIYFT